MRINYIIILLVLVFGCNTSKNQHGEFWIWSELDLYEGELISILDSYTNISNSDSLFMALEAMYEYIEGVQLELLQSVCKDCEILLDIDSKNALDFITVNNIMLGDDESGIAYDYGKKLDSLVELLVQDERMLNHKHYIYILLGTPDPPSIGNESATWEEYTFKNKSLITAINDLKFRKIHVLNLQLELCRLN